VAQHDGNRGRRSATVALAAVGDSSKPASEVGGEQVLWQGGGVVDQFEAKKRSEGGSPELSTVVLAADGEPAVEARTGGRGSGDWVGELRGTAPEHGDGSAGRSKGPGQHCTVVPQWRHGGAVGTEEGERVLHGGRAPFIAGRGGGRRVARWQNRGWRNGSGRGLEWSARSERGRSMVQTGRMTGGPNGFDIFRELSKPAQTWKLKMDALCCSKNSQFCILLDWGIMNNFLNCSDIQI
jgi:hypothetical protein